MGVFLIGGDILSKTSYEQYAKDIQNLVRQLPRQLTREQEEQIGKIYLSAFKSIEKKLEKCTKLLLKSNSIIYFWIKNLKFSDVSFVNRV